MSGRDAITAAALSGAAATMSFLGLNVPIGFEALHFVSAIAMASGYIVGCDFETKKRSLLIISLTVLSVICVVSYYICINFSPPGWKTAILLTILVVGSFWPFSFMLAIAKNKK